MVLVIKVGERLKIGAISPYVIFSKMITDLLIVRNEELNLHLHRRVYNKEPCNAKTFLRQLYLDITKKKKIVDNHSTILLDIKLRLRLLKILLFHLPNARLRLSFAQI